MSESQLERDDSTQYAVRSDSSEAHSGTVRRAVKRSMFDDPVVRRLTILVAGLIIAFLLTVISAYFTGVLGDPTPKTKLQRDITMLSQEAMRAPKNTSIWHAYIAALIQDKQYGKAQEVIDMATKAVDQTPTQDFLAAQAELYLSTGENEKAIKTADQVRKLLKQYHDKAVKKDGSPESLGEKVNPNSDAMLLVKAEAYVNLKRVSDAIKALNEYLKNNKGDADVLIRRADLKAGQGDKKGAEADYRKALAYMPGDKTALAGLKKIGAN